MVLKNLSNHFRYYHLHACDLMKRNQECGAHEVRHESPGRCEHSLAFFLATSFFELRPLPIIESFLVVLFRLLCAPLTPYLFCTSSATAQYLPSSYKSRNDSPPSVT